jgi:uncharacterized protein YggE
VDVAGEAEREVVPDRVVVAVSIRTPVLPTPAEALALGVARRARVREALAAATPGVTISDARVTTVAEHDHIEEPDARGRVVSRLVLRGHTGVCELRVEAEAGRAAAIVGAAGSHPDVAATRPGFVIGPTLRRAVERELEQEAVRDALGRGAGLAAAAGMRCGEVLSIGEAPSAGEPYERDIMLADMRMEAGPLEEAIGELVPEAQTLSARVPVRLALLPGS